MNEPNERWNNRPPGSSSEQLLAWALCQVADAISQGADDIANAIDRNDIGSSLITLADTLAETITDVGVVRGGLRDIGSLQYIAERVGGNLERIADHMELMEKSHES